MRAISRSKAVERECDVCGTLAAGSVCPECDSEIATAQA